MTTSPPPADVETVLFDLDDTLVSYSVGTDEVLHRAFEREDVDPMFPAEAYFERFHDFVETGTTTPEARRACFAALAEERGHDPDLGRAVADTFSTLRDASQVTLLPGAMEALDVLDDDHRIGLVTNGPPDVQKPKLAATDLTDRFETVVYAGYDTEPKPHPDPFHRALDALDSTPDRAVHVGNSLRSDVAGARAAGVGSVWIPAYDEEHDAVPDYRLDSLADLRTPPWR